MLIIEKEKIKKRKKNNNNNNYKEEANTLETWRWIQGYFWKLILPPSFLSIFGRKLFDGHKKKTHGPTIYFPFSPVNQTHSKKIYLPIFFPKFFIHLVSPPNKHTFSFFPSFWTHSSLQSLHGIRDVERWSILQRTRSYNKISKLQLPVPSQCMLLFN